MRFSIEKCIILLTTCLMAWSLAHRPLLAEAKYMETIWAVVNNTIITEEDVKRRALVPLSEAQKKYKGNELTLRIQGILEEVLNQLIDRQLLVQEAHRLIEKNPVLMEDIEKELAAFLKEAVDEVGSLTKFYEIATKEGINPTEKKKELKDDLMAERLLKDLVYKKVTISPKDIRDYYQSHLEEFTQGKQAKARQIFLKFSSFPNKEEAKKKAEELRDRAKRGEDFEALVKEFSQGPRASTGGLWDFEDVKVMRKDLKEPILALEKGEISDIIQSPVGYHIFKAEEVKPAKEADFMALQEEIRDRLYKEESTRRKKEYIQNLKKNATIKITSGGGGTIHD
ncbi:MAG TPA: peptidylprolyl isomerase [Candidatus Hypogeohydataceae bacterium YC38]